MTPEQAVAQEIWAIFAEPTPVKRERYEQFRRQEAAIGQNLMRFFSEFIPAHLLQGDRIARQFEDLVRQANTEVDGLQAVIREYRRLEPITHPDLLYHALRVFITHYHGAITLDLPSILITDPELVVPSRGNGTSAEVGLRMAMAAGSPEETHLDWFREDPLLNEHHTHWHVVYNGAQPLERQGEMFFYMHRQMLARYNTERLALGMPPVKAYDDFRKPIAVGYAPGPDVRLGRAFDDRAPNAGIFNAGNIQYQQRALKALMSDLQKGDFKVTTASEISQINRLGMFLEPNGEELMKPSRDYTGYHGAGHVIIADSDADGIRGVMGRPMNAIRDVVFWEWHQGIDDVYRLWQEGLSPYNFKADAPNTIVRKSVDAGGHPYSPDLILCRTADLPAGITAEQAGALLFGGTNWNKDFGNEVAAATSSTGQPIQCQTADTVRTRMEAGTIQFRDIDGSQQAYSFPFLNHDEYNLFIRVENRNPVKTTVTVRLFLVPDTLAEDRTKWIELDKFLADLNPLEKKVICRDDTNSSVIRKPAVKNPAASGTTFDPIRIETSPTVSTCRCGFPYHMLWPRGTPAGMKFRLMVLLTNAEIDMGGQSPNCGSLSFCGTRDQQYPDRRPLGYPFNRPFAPAKGITATIAGQDNMASRVFTIQQLPAPHA